MEQAAADVRCATCGAWCAAVDADAVDCTHCGNRTEVPSDVREFLAAAAFGRSVRWFSDDVGALVPTGAAPAAEVVEAFCARCGHPLSFAHGDVARCPACGTDMTTRLRGTVQLLLGAMRLAHQRQSELHAELAQQRAIDGQRERALVAISTAIAALETQERALLAARPKVFPAIARILASACAPVILILVYFRFVDREAAPPPAPANSSPVSTFQNDECVRIGDGICKGDSLLRRCEKGVPESIDCAALGMRCLRDACGAGAHCCSVDASK